MKKLILFYFTSLLIFGQGQDIRRGGGSGGSIPGTITAVPPLTVNTFPVSDSTGTNLVNSSLTQSSGTNINNSGNISSYSITTGTLTVTNGIFTPFLIPGAFVKMDATSGTLTNVVRLQTLGTTNLTLLGELDLNNLVSTNGILLQSLTASRMLVSDANKNIISSGVVISALTNYGFNGQHFWNTGLGAFNQLAGPIDQPFSVVSTAPIQAASSVAGNALNLTAANATAGSSNAGAANGGAVTITGGDAARLTSGGGNGGAIILKGGTSTASGTGGVLSFLSGNAGASGSDTGAATFGSADNGQGGSSASGAVTIKSGSTLGTASGNITISTGIPGTISSVGTPGTIFLMGATPLSSSAASGTGANGGAQTLTLGTGGAQSGNTSSTGGNGGAWTVTGGAGGAATGAGGTHLGGNGSTVTVTSGAGGNATGASGTRTGGNSGTLTLATGAAGTGASANGTVGSIVLSPGGTAMLTISSTLGLQIPTTITAPGTTGNQTINKPNGRVNIAAAGTTVTVTDSYCLSTSTITATCATNDTTAYVKNIVASNGSFIITLGAAATAEVAISFKIEN